MKISIGVADDQQLFLRSLSGLIRSFPGCDVVTEALNGQELLKSLAALEVLPDIILTDVQMPIMGGPGTVKESTAKYPAIATIALSMKEDDHSVLGMLRAGCSAYLLKDVHPRELKEAITEVKQHGYYNGDVLSRNRRRLLRSEADEIKLTDREKDFLKLACSDFTYKEIAARMFLSEKTIDGYRDALFQKMNVRSRTGMALDAIKRNLVVL